MASLNLNGAWDMSEGFYFYEPLKIKDKRVWGPILMKLMR